LGDPLVYRIEEPLRLGLSALLFHGDLGAKDGAPFFVLGNRHPALHADPDSLLRWLVLPKQTLQ
jgi:hypothetical protein